MLLMEVSPVIRDEEIGIGESPVLSMAPATETAGAVSADNL
jgi:hypothetical protein